MEYFAKQPPLSTDELQRVKEDNHRIFDELWCKNESHSWIWSIESQYHRVIANRTRDSFLIELGNSISGYAGNDYRKYRFFFYFDKHYYFFSLDCPYFHEHDYDLLTQEKAYEYNHEIARALQIEQYLYYKKHHSFYNSVNNDFFIADNIMFYEETSYPHNQKEQDILMEAIKSALTPFLLEEELFWQNIGSTTATNPELSQKIKHAVYRRIENIQLDPTLDTIRNTTST